MAQTNFFNDADQPAATVYNHEDRIFLHLRDTLSIAETRALVCYLERHRLIAHALILGTEIALIPAPMPADDIWLFNRTMQTDTIAWLEGRLKIAPANTPAQLSLF